jgi:hypothetical protein
MKATDDHRRASCGFVRIAATSSRSAAADSYCSLPSRETNRGTGGEIRIGEAVEHGRYGAKPFDVGFPPAADLELEPAVTVGRDHFFQRFREAVADTFS